MNFPPDVPVPCQEDPELFFSDDGTYRGERFYDGTVEACVRKARDLCATCMFSDACLETAMKHNERGIWGGTTTDERKALRRSQHRRDRREATATNVA